VRNPVEFGGHSEYDIRTYDKVLDPVLAWDGCDLAILFGGYALYDEALADYISRRRVESGKPILVHDLYADEDRPAFAPLRSRRIPIFVSADVAARAAAALARGGQARRRALRAADWRARRGAAARRRTPSLPAGLRRALASARRRPARALLEEEASRLLEHYGFPVLPSALARGERQAVEAADRLGYPIALKVHAASIVHKSDSGGVHLDLRGAEDVRRAWRAVAKLAPRAEARLTPFRRGGVEAIAGARRDPEYGPILLFGAGGVLAEILRDAVLRTLPCPPEEIEEMVGSTRLAPLLAGARGARAADVGAVASALGSLARLILEVPEVSDVEVNPLRCAADGAVALDARILVSR
jgi:acetyltransferase